MLLNKMKLTVRLPRVLDTMFYQTLQIIVGLFEALIDRNQQVPDGQKQQIKPKYISLFCV